MYCSTKDNRYSVWCGIKQRCFNPNEPHYVSPVLERFKKINARLAFIKS